MLKIKAVPENWVEVKARGETLPRFKVQTSCTKYETRGEISLQGGETLHIISLSVNAPD